MGKALKYIGAAGAIGAAPFTGGASLAAVGPLLGSALSPDNTKLTPAEQQAQTGQGANAAALSGVGIPAIQGAAGYYQRLMGSRQAAQAATAPAAANISEAYKGAGAGVDRSFLQGGQRDQAIADLNRDKTSQIARLYAGVQPSAAAALGSLGTSAVGGANNVYGSIMGQGLDQRKFAEGVDTQNGQASGNILYSILKGGFNAWNNRSGGLSSIPNVSMGIPNSSNIPGATPVQSLLG